MKSRSRYILPEAFGFFTPLAIIAFVTGFLSLWVACVISSAAALFVVWFFRNPERKAPEGSTSLLSPADGRILKIEEGVAPAKGGLEGSFTKVSIFMNIFNVHVNRSPCRGEVKKITYYPGKFLSANLDKASSENERNALLISMDDGREILVVQIAGLIARRIVCWVKEGERLDRGERFGLIRFGSRLEVFMPEGTKTAVSVGDKVTAGETTIGYLS
ncbi:MAG: phosphatidylserine decarboxylase family protein [Syntrophales bacterium]|jgi:phosphatidylserine decarboxylase|nr:phosphatidylserine decarboxylase family protein [Syntrophales bacterium]MCK9528208.1 phosphatidylserine decarboxylase family protein [Syntrophales bacterium]MDX9921356.1 phosphatidylserine decarboxylase family protein [Syntrophales bacterium]